MQGPPVEGNMPLINRLLEELADAIDAGTAPEQPVFPLQETPTKRKWNFNSSDRIANFIQHWRAKMPVDSNQYAIGQLLKWAVQLPIREKINGPEELYQWLRSNYKYGQLVQVRTPLSALKGRIAAEQYKRWLVELARSQKLRLISSFPLRREGEQPLSLERPNKPGKKRNIDCIELIEDGGFYVRACELRDNLHYNTNKVAAMGRREEILNEMLAGRAVAVTHTNQKKPLVAMQIAPPELAENEMLLDISKLRWSEWNRQISQICRHVANGTIEFARLQITGFPHGIRVVRPVGAIGKTIALGQLPHIIDPNSGSFAYYQWSKSLVEKLREKGRINCRYDYREKGFYRSLAILMLAEQAESLPFELERIEKLAPGRCYQIEWRQQYTQAIAKLLNNTLDAIRLELMSGEVVFMIHPSKFSDLDSDNSQN